MVDMIGYDQEWLKGAALVEIAHHTKYGGWNIPRGTQLGCPLRIILDFIYYGTYIDRSI